VKTITITIGSDGMPNVTFNTSPDEQVKILTRPEFKRVKRALEQSYHLQERSYKLAAYNAPAQLLRR